MQTSSLITWVLIAANAFLFYRAESKLNLANESRKVFKFFRFGNMTVQSIRKGRLRCVQTWTLVIQTGDDFRVFGLVLPVT